MDCRVKPGNDEFAFLFGNPPRVLHRSFTIPDYGESRPTARFAAVVLRWGGVRVA
jgi:hypothetical protein